MAKKEVEKYKYPSRFGSHKSMVNQAETDKLNDSTLVVCNDENGYYITSINKLDDGQIDWARAKGSRVKQEKEKKGKK